MRWPLSEIQDNLCNNPEPLKKRRSKGLVIAGCGTKKHIDLFKYTLEGAKIPLFLCEFVDLLAPTGRDSSSDPGATEVAKLIVRAHVQKVAAAFDIAGRARAVGVREVMGAGKKQVTRRGFLRLPLIAARIVSHYENIPLFDEKKCIASRSPCRECIRHCPFGALDIRNGKVPRDP